MRAILTAFFCTMALSAFAGPVLKTQCKLTHDASYRVELRLAKGFDLGQLTLKNPDQDFSQDLSRYAENKFVVDLSSRGGVTGYTLDYRLSGVGEYVTYSGDINCDEHKKKNHSDADGEFSFLSPSSGSIKKSNAFSDLDQEKVYDVEEQLALDFR